MYNMVLFNQLMISYYNSNHSKPTLQCDQKYHLDHLAWLDFLDNYFTLCLLRPYTSNSWEWLRLSLRHFLLYSNAPWKLERILPFFFNPNICHPKSLSCIPSQIKSFSIFKYESLYLEFHGSITSMILSPSVLFVQLLA